MLESNDVSFLKKTTSQLFDLLDSRSLSNPKIINFYIPNKTPKKTGLTNLGKKFFQTYSITGYNCELNCNHCEGKILRTMIPIHTPNQLFEKVIQLKKKGGIGCLISGGSKLDGSINFKPFIPIIKQIKHKLGLTVFVHTGIINFETAIQLKEAKVDLALIDIVGSKKTLTKLNLKFGLEDYVNSLEALQKAKIQFVPHVLVGLDGEELDNEFNALRIISNTKPSALVIIGFMPISRTKMEKNQPASPMNIVKILIAAKLLFPKTPIALGCMRQRGKNRTITELLAIKAGVSAIAFPSKETINYAKTNGYEIHYHPYCCAQIYKENIS